jgi:hypothetical protein
MRAYRHRRRAQSIIETVVGIIFLIPIVLFMFDVGLLILANTSNDNLAKQAARAAASAQPDPPLDDAGMQAQKAAGYPAFRTAANTAATNIVNNYKAGSKSGWMTDITYQKMWYNGVAVGGGAIPGGGDVDPGVGNVAVFTSMQVQLPVPFPGFDTTRTFFAKAVEPIVAIPPE